MQFIIDKKNILGPIVISIIEKYFRDIVESELKFLYVWRLIPQYDDGQRVMASVTKMSNRDRDLFGADVRLEVDKDIWDELKNVDRTKLLFHELTHIVVERENENEDAPFKYDKEDRICFSMQPHDIDIRRFKSELKKYGLSEEENKIRLFLNKVYKKKGITVDPLKSFNEEESNDEQENESTD